MAGTSLLALIDDIATILDDVSVMTKVAAKKTSGVLGDDLALNAQQVAGVDASREIPVVWAVAKGSFLNKVILVPAALALSAFLPMTIPYLLLIGGLFLCFEGFEKVFEKALKAFKPSSEKEAALREIAPIDEKDKIKGAVRTDFILSAEIIVISLGTMAQEPLLKQALVLTTISILMTVGVYGLVAGIVKLDDLGLYLLKSGQSFARTIGAGILKAAPSLMKFLGIAGTAAMFLVGGSLVVHAVPPLHHLSAENSVGIQIVIDAVTGLFSGAVIVGVLHLFSKLKKAKS